MSRAHWHCSRCMPLQGQVQVLLQELLGKRSQSHWNRSTSRSTLERPGHRNDRKPRRLTLPIR